MKKLFPKYMNAELNVLIIDYHPFTIEVNTDVLEKI